jgi:hypothetical protein
MRILHRLGRAIHRAGRLVRDSCAGQCCGACSRVYAFNACCLAAPIQTVYVCSDAKCQGTPIAEVFRIVVGSQCYSRAPSSIPVGISPTMVLLDGADIDACDHGGCSSPECVDYCGNRFIPGVLCPGQTYSGPPVYMAAIPDQNCGVLNLSGTCFKFDPSVTVPESQVPPGATFPSPNALLGPQNPNCCACVSGCSETVQTVTECDVPGSREVERRCCCTSRRDVTITSTSFVEYNPAIAYTIRRTITFSTLIQYDDTNVETNRVNTLATIFEENRDGTSFEFTTTFLPTGACLPVAPNAYLGSFMPFSWVTDCAVNFEADGNVARADTSIIRLCNRGVHTGAWTLTRQAIPGDPLAGQVIARGNYSSTIDVEFFGRCTGGCTNTAGRSGIIADRGGAGGCSGCGDNGTKGATI